MSDTKIYPRGTPYQPPEELMAQEAKLRRWTILLIVSSLAILFFTIGTGFFLVKKLNRQNAVAQADKSNPINPVVPAGANDPKQGKPEAKESSPVLENPKGDGKSAPEAQKDPVAPAPSNDAKSTETKPSPLPESQRERFLDTLGKLTGVHLYQSYLCIGLLADCTESEVYTEEDAKKWLERLTSQMELVDQQLELVGKMDLDADEQKDLNRCRQAAALLRVQAKELKAYWETTDKEHAMKYHAAREEAWEAVSDVLQLPK